jgi:hypothetical protein
LNKTIKKSTLLILIATMLIASSMSLTQVHARGEITGPQPTGDFYLFPPIPNLVNVISSSDPPSVGRGEIGALPVSPDVISGFQTYPLPGIKTQYWFVFYSTSSTISGQEEVFVHYNPTGMSKDQQRHLRLCIWDPVDFNLDGTVNALDVILMLKAIQSGANDPWFDINHDGVVNFADLIIVVQFATRGIIVNQGGGCSGQVRLPWMDITSGVDIVNHYVYGFTGHFSGFGIH